MPRIKTTRTVTVALLLLRIYLIVMLLIILAKFVRDAMRQGEPPRANAVGNGVGIPADQVAGASYPGYIDSERTRFCSGAGNVKRICSSRTDCNSTEPPNRQRSMSTQC